MLRAIGPPEAAAWLFGAWVALTLAACVVGAADEDGDALLVDPLVVEDEPPPTVGAPHAASTGTASPRTPMVFSNLRRDTARSDTEPLLHICTIYTRAWSHYTSAMLPSG